MKKTIIVTGGAGYIGSTLCRELLNRGYKVKIIDSLIYGDAAIKDLLKHPDVELFIKDIRNINGIKKIINSASALIHLAAIVGDKLCEKNQKAAVSVNFEATKNIVNNCSKIRGLKFIFASTSSNYGVMDNTKIADENFPLNPVSLYAETKVDCEQYILDLKSYEFCPVILRFASAFGISGRTRFDLSVNSFTFEALRDKKIIVFAANTWRPYIHVYDMSRAIIALLEAPEKKVKKEVFNVGENAMNYQKIEIARMIKKRLPQIEIDFIEKRDDRSYKLSFDKIRAKVGFRVTKSVDDGIIELIDAIKSGAISEKYFFENSLDCLKEIN